MLERLVLVIAKLAGFISVKHSSNCLWRNFKGGRKVLCRKTTSAPFWELGIPPF